jgi:hypothetical protein
VTESYYRPEKFRNVMYELSGTEPIRESCDEKEEIGGSWHDAEDAIPIQDWYQHVSARERFGLGAPYDIVR